MDLIVMDKRGIVVQCLYYGYKRENMISNSTTLYSGDIFKITNQGKYVLGIGWFVLIRVNGEITDFVHIEELEKAINSGKALPVIDLMLDHFILSFQLDKSLELRNKELFLNLSQKHKELSYLFKRTFSRLPARS